MPSEWSSEQGIVALIKSLIQEINAIYHTLAKEISFWLTLALISP